MRANCQTSSNSCSRALSRTAGPRAEAAPGWRRGVGGVSPVARVRWRGAVAQMPQRQRPLADCWPGAELDDRCQQSTAGGSKAVTSNLPAASPPWRPARRAEPRRTNKATCCRHTRQANRRNAPPARMAAGVRTRKRQREDGVLDSVELTPESASAFVDQMREGVTQGTIEELMGAVQRASPAGKRALVAKGGLRRFRQWLKELMAGGHVSASSKRPVSVERSVLVDFVLQVKPSLPFAQAGAHAGPGENMARGGTALLLSASKLSAVAGSWPTQPSYTRPALACGGPTGPGSKTTRARERREANEENTEPRRRCRNTPSVTPPLPSAFARLPTTAHRS